jgi:hypothetical protein
VLNREKFNAASAGDVPSELATVMADSQVPWGVEGLAGTVSEPAWRSEPSRYLVAIDDHMIPPPAHLAMAERAGATVTTSPGATR